MILRTSVGSATWDKGQIYARLARREGKRKHRSSTYSGHIAPVAPFLSKSGHSVAASINDGVVGHAGG